jgi:hypothetical protein
MCTDGDSHLRRWQQLLDLFRQPVALRLGILDGMDIVLQHDLLRRMLEPHRRQPASIGQTPGPSATINPLMAKQESRC